MSGTPGRCPAGDRASPRPADATPESHGNSCIGRPRDHRDRKSAGSGRAREESTSSTNTPHLRVRWRVNRMTERSYLSTPTPDVTFFSSIAVHYFNIPDGVHVRTRVPIVF